MNSIAQIRCERSEDRSAIHELTARAFGTMPYADGDEANVIDRLRHCGALALSLVATVDERIVGHLALSPGKAANASYGWFALGPISVVPNLQKQGIGSQLMTAATTWLENEDASGCVLVGNPAYYRRFGFRVRADLAPAGQPAEYFQVLVLNPDAPLTVVEFHPAFFGPV